MINRIGLNYDSLWLDETGMLHGEATICSSTGFADFTFMYDLRDGLLCCEVDDDDWSKYTEVIHAKTRAEIKKYLKENNIF